MQLIETNQMKLIYDSFFNYLRFYIIFIYSDRFFWQDLHLLQLQMTIHQCCHKHPFRIPLTRISLKIVIKEIRVILLDLQMIVKLYSSGKYLFIK